jgi:ATP synthase protein I
MSGLARGMRIGTEFIAAILVGAGLGYLIDLGLGTSPWGLLILLLMGFAAGILNVIRVVAEMNAATPAPKGSDMGPDADDEERTEER